MINPNIAQSRTPIIGQCVNALLMFTAALFTAAGPWSARARADDSDKEQVVEKWLEDQNEYSPLRVTARLIDGKIQGECHFYTRDRLLYKTETYKDGVQDGPLTRYYPNGKVYFVARFRNGDVVDTTTYWPDGTPAGILRYDRTGAAVRIFQTTYFRDGRKCVEAVMINGVYQGLRRHYVPSGTQFAMTLWENGRQVAQKLTAEVTQRDLGEVQAVGAFQARRQQDFWPPAKAAR